MKAQQVFSVLYWVLPPALEERVPTPCLRTRRGRRRTPLPGVAHTPRYHERVTAPGPLPSPAPSGDIRVLIVDDHALLRAGTLQILEAAEGISVVGEAADGDAALAMAAELRPDVMLVDIRMPGRNGIEVARQVVAEELDIRVIVLSAYDDDDYVRAALAAGVSGYLLKTMPGDELVRAVRAASSGMTVLDPVISHNLAQPRSVAAAPAPDDSRLSWRERQVVDLVAEGLPNKTIATRLGISARTVEGHLNHIFTKLDLSSRTELVRFALAQPVPGTGTGSPGSPSER